MNRLARIAALTDAEAEPIRALRPDTTVTVYHGTNVQDAYHFCTVGIDGRAPVGRVYPHWDEGKALKFGLFVAPDAKTALKFGRYALEFAAHGRDLISRFPHQMKRGNPLLHGRYPASFRPLVSSEMLDLSVEPQALYIGLAAPDQITRVWSLKDNRWDGLFSMSRDDFLRSLRPGEVREVASHFDPTDYKMTLDQFLQRVTERGGNVDSKEDIMDTLLYIYRRDGHLSGIGEVPYSLLRRIERQLDTYIRQHPEAGS